MRIGPDGYSDSSFERQQEINDWNDEARSNEPPSDELEDFGVKGAITHRTGENRPGLDERADGEEYMEEDKK